jgi:hypothetical protein
LCLKFQPSGVGGESAITGGILAVIQETAGNKRDLDSENLEEKGQKNPSIQNNSQHCIYFEVVTVVVMVTVAEVPMVAVVPVVTVVQWTVVTL